MIRCPRCHHRLRGGTCDEHGPPTRSHVDGLPAAPPARLAAWPQGACLAIGGSAQVFAVDDGAGAAVVKWARWRDTAARRRFDRERERLVHIGAGAVPRVLDAGVADGWPYIVLERMHGQTVAELFATQPRAALAAGTPRLVRVIARALARVHERGVIHADLKPENIFVRDGEARLIDFGAVDGGFTIHYASPEQLHGDALTPASDVYALACIAFELVTGRPPFVGDHPAIEYGHTLCRAPRPSELADVAGDLELLVLAGLAKRPASRPALSSLCAALEHLSAAEPARSATSAARRHERGPAALLWIGGGARVQIAAAVSEASGRIVRERAEGTLAAFLWHDHDHPVRAAIAVARKLGADVAAVVHSGEVAVRRTPRRVAIHGDLIDHPERWCPPVPCAGLLVTSAAADHLGDELVGAQTAPGFHRLAELDRTRVRHTTVPDLVARNGLVDDLARGVALALDGGGPRLLTLLGKSGAGKSRTLAEVGARIAGRAAHVIELAGTAGIAGRPTVAPALAASLAGCAGRTPLDRLRAAADRGVVILVDDAHRVEDEVLDLLETAASWHTARLAIVVATDRSLLEGRPRWGSLAKRHERYELRPLDDASAQALLRRLLAPARRVPDALVVRLAARAGGSPGALIGLAREIHRRGLVRRFPDSQEFHVAADEIDAITLEPDRRWRAARELAALPNGMVGFVEVCAVLGRGFDLVELEAVQHAAPTVDTVIDTSAGLAWLERNRLLRRAGDGWHFVDEIVAESAYDQVSAPARKAIHAAALAHALERRRRCGADLGSDHLARVAHHARGADHRDVAAAAFISLGHRARLSHSHVEAERMATAAIAVLAADHPALLAEALVERARARRRMALFEAARSDLARARELAEHAGDRGLQIEALVEEGAVCDFTDRLLESAAAIERAASLVDASTSPAIAARVDNWLGVVRARQGRSDEAGALLERAILAAAAIGDGETYVGSMLMLGGVHRRSSRFDDARAAVDVAIAHSEAQGDAFHLTVGLFNRIVLCRMIGDPSAAERDCARAIEIAERHGYGQMEIAGWLNLSEVYLSMEHDDDALSAARRGFEAARRRFGDHPPVVMTSWLALLEAGVGHAEEAIRLLAHIDAADTARSPLLHLRRIAVETITCAAPAFDEIVAGVRGLEPDDRNAFTWFLRKRGVEEHAA